MNPGQAGESINYLAVFALASAVWLVVAIAIYTVARGGKDDDPEDHEGPAGNGELMITALAWPLYLLLLLAAIVFVVVPGC